ncbi:MAG TPA: hypothetical protein VLV16_15590 [Gemmatimonadales bacterium]|nr:hypothetical protein [Gemmatimonadales bacterium]
MSRRLLVPALTLAALLLSGFAGCPDSTDPASSGAGVDAVVHYVNVEGGCWTIHVDPNQVYQPLNLPTEFEHDGLAVRVEFQQRNDMATYCMVGPVVQILSIHTR